MNIILARNHTIYLFYKRGKKQTDIARMFGLSRQRVGQIIKQFEPKEDPLTLY